MSSFRAIFLLLLFMSKVQPNDNNNFLTEYEYSMMLYIEPRGLSCIKCHGLTGKKTDNIRYYRYSPKSVRFKRKEVRINPIYKLNFKDFRKGVISRRNRFMPTYKLSHSEIKSIYFYLQKVNGLIKDSSNLESLNSKSILK